MTPAERDAIAERHVRDTHYVSGVWCAYCMDPELEEVPWPCDAARLLAALTEAEERLTDMSINIWRLEADADEEGWFELGLYRLKDDAEADRALVEETYPGRPYWINFQVSRHTVGGRRTPDELADALPADRSDVDTIWTDPNGPDSWFSEHGEPRP